MALKDSQTHLYEHSEVKVRLLKLYLDRYLNILTQSKYIGDIYVHDLFCGEGIYANNGKGSPIIILETIKEIHESNKIAKKRTGHFTCHFNDFDGAKVDKLKKEIERRNLFNEEIGKLYFTREDYNSLLPKIVNKANSLTNEKAFIFLDPYGYKDISVNHIISLLDCRKTEVLLFLPTHFMFRFERKGTPESLQKFITELVPQSRWPNSETSIDFIENLKEAFREAVGKKFFVDTFIITRDKNQFFCLFFFTSHIYGFDRMLDAKWKIDEEEGRGWHFEKVLSLFNSQPKKANTQKFEKSLIKFLNERQRTNSELYEFTIRSGHLTEHANQVLSKIQEDGHLDVTSWDGKPIRRNAFFIRYKEYRDEPNKVIVKLR